MRAKIYLFSQTGTTFAVGAQIRDGLAIGGNSVEVVSIGSDRAVDLAGVDVVGVGAPAHIFRPSWNVREFIRSLPELEGRRFFSFVLYGTHPGATGNRLRKWLARRGGTDIGHFSARGADRFLGYLREGALFSPGHPSEKELRAAFAFGQRVAERFGSGKIETEPKDPPTPLLYALERALMKRAFIWAFYSRFFWADRGCIGCKKCLHECPTGNIRLNERGHPTWGTRCIMCGRCSLVCPVGAVHCPWDWWWSRVTMKANIRRGIRAGISFERVAFPPENRSRGGGES